MKTLVVCYSLTGNTAALAHEVAATLNADFETVEDTRQGRGFFGYVKLAIDVLARTRPRLAETAHEPADYDLVVLASPIWSSRISAPMTEYALQHAGEFKRVALVCTSRSSQPGYAERCAAGLAERAGLTPVATLGLGHRELKQDHSEAVERFVDMLSNHEGRQD